MMHNTLAILFISFALICVQRATLGIDGGGEKETESRLIGSDSMSSSIEDLVRFVAERSADEDDEKTRTTTETLPSVVEPPSARMGKVDELDGGGGVAPPPAEKKGGGGVSAGRESRERLHQIKWSKVPRQMMLVTIATRETDGVTRLRTSAQVMGHRLYVFGKDKDDAEHFSLAQKIRIMHKNLAPYRRRKDLLILYCDAFDVVINARVRDILRRFAVNFSDKNVVFGPDVSSWPDRKLADLFPKVEKTKGLRYLNSGLYIGYAATIFRMLTIAQKLATRLNEKRSDQRIYSMMYIRKNIRDRLKMGIDNRAEMFIDTSNIADELSLRWDKHGHAKVNFHRFNTHPLIIHGNGWSRYELNTLSNYIGHEYNIKTNKCRTCLKPAGLDKHPPILLALFITRQVANINDFFERVIRQRFPADRMHLFMYNNQGQYFKAVRRFLTAHKSHFKSIVRYTRIKKGMALEEAKKQALQHAIDLNVEYYFMVSNDAFLTNPKSFELLIEREHRTKHAVIAPMLVHQGTNQSNFWGARHFCTEPGKPRTGFYQTFDYDDIISGRRRGTWNIAYARGVLMVRRDRLAQMRDAYVKALTRKEPAVGGNGGPPEEDEIVLDNYRSFGAHWYLFVDNTAYYGKLEASPKSSSDGTKVKPKEDDYDENQVDEEETEF